MHARFLISDVKTACFTKGNAMITGKSRFFNVVSTSHGFAAFPRSSRDLDCHAPSDTKSRTRSVLVKDSLKGDGGYISSSRSYVSFRGRNYTIRYLSRSRSGRVIIISASKRQRKFICAENERIFHDIEYFTKAHSYLNANSLVWKG